MSARFTQSQKFSVRKQVSRLSINLLGRLPILRQWHVPVRPLHGYWDSPEFTSGSLGEKTPAR